MNILERLGIKSSATDSMVALHFGVGRPHYNKTDYKSLAENGYERNVYVYRAVTLIAESFAELEAWPVDNKGKRVRGTEVDSFLKLWNSPNKRYSGYEYRKQAAIYVLLSGNNYTEMISPLTRNRPPLELWNLRPDRMKIKSSGSELIAGYEYRIGLATPKPYSADQIGHTRIFAPTDDFYGVSPVMVAAKAIDQMNSANDWNTALFQNGARPSGFLKTVKNLTKEQFDRLRAMLDDDYSGARNSGRPMLLEGGLEWQQAAYNPQDLNWLSGKRENAKEIAIAIGVPPEMLGDSANKNYSNYQEARKSFYEETVLPFADFMFASYSHFLLPKFGLEKLAYDRSQIDALQEDRQRVANRGMALVDRGVINREELRIELGYPPTNDPAMKVFTIAPGIQAIGTVLANPNTPENDQSDNSDLVINETPSGQESVNQSLPDGDKTNVELVESPIRYLESGSNQETLRALSKASEAIKSLPSGIKVKPNGTVVIHDSKIKKSS